MVFPTLFNLSLNLAIRSSRSEPQSAPGLVFMDGAMLSKPLIQFSVEGQGCVPSLLFDLRPNYGGGDEDSDDLFQKVPCMHCYTQCP